MKTITLRDIPDDLARRIQERAAESGASLTRTVLEMLREKEPRHKRRLFHDLDDLAGAWTQEEAAEIDVETGRQRQIDSELWR